VYSWFKSPLLLSLFTQQPYLMVLSQILVQGQFNTYFAGVHFAELKKLH